MKGQAAGDLWHLTIDDLLASPAETPRLTGPGPFVINLSTSTAPISIPADGFPEYEHLRAYQVKQTDDGRTRYRLRLGLVTSELEADAILAAVRERYPSAFATNAGDDDVRLAKREPARTSQTAAQPAEPPAPSAPGSAPAPCLATMLAEDPAEEAKPKVEVKAAAKVEAKAKAKVPAAPPPAPPAAESGVFTIDFDAFLPPMDPRFAAPAPKAAAPAASRQSRSSSKRRKGAAVSKAGAARQMPAPEVPVAKVSATKAPVAKAAAAKVPAAGVPVAKVSAAKVPAAKVAATDGPVANVATAKVSAAKVPATEVPVAKVAVAKVPAAKVPATEIPVAKVAAAKVPDAKVAVTATRVPAAEVVAPVAPSPPAAAVSPPRAAVASRPTVAAPPPAVVPPPSAAAAPRAAVAAPPAVVAATLFAARAPEPVAAPAASAQPNVFVEPGDDPNAVTDQVAVLTLASEDSAGEVSLDDGVQSMILAFAPELQAELEAELELAILHDSTPKGAVVEPAAVEPEMEIQPVPICGPAAEAVAGSVTAIDAPAAIEDELDLESVVARNNAMVDSLEAREGPAGVPLPIHPVETKRDAGIPARETVPDDRIPVLETVLDEGIPALKTVTHDRIPKLETVPDDGIPVLESMIDASRPVRGSLVEAPGAAVERTAGDAIPVLEMIVEAPRPDDAAMVAAPASALERVDTSIPELDVELDSIDVFVDPAAASALFEVPTFGPAEATAKEAKAVAQAEPASISPQALAPVAEPESLGLAAEPAALAEPPPLAKPRKRAKPRKLAEPPAVEETKRAASPIEILADPLPNMDSTQTIRELTPLELADDQASHWFAIQLSLSEEAVDAEKVPHLDIFESYRLYSVAGLDQGQFRHALRLGFFSEEGAAQMVAGYLGCYFEAPAVKRVSEAERQRFADRRVVPRRDIGATGMHTVIELSTAPRAPQRRLSDLTVSDGQPASDSGSLWSRLVAPLKR